MIRDFPFNPGEYASMSEAVDYIHAILELEAFSNAQCLEWEQSPGLHPDQQPLSPHYLKAHRLMQQAMNENAFADMELHYAYAAAFHRFRGRPEAAAKYTTLAECVRQLRERTANRPPTSN